MTHVPPSQQPHRLFHVEHAPRSRHCRRGRDSSVEGAPLPVTNFGGTLFHVEHPLFPDRFLSRTFHVEQLSPPTAFVLDCTLFHVEQLSPPTASPLGRFLAERFLVGRPPSRSHLVPRGTTLASTAFLSWLVPRGTTPAPTVSFLGRTPAPPRTPPAPTVFSSRSHLVPRGTSLAPTA